MFAFTVCALSIAREPEPVEPAFVAEALIPARTHAVVHMCSVDRAANRRVH